MIEIQKNYINSLQEKAVIVAIRRAGIERFEIDEHLNELKDLATTAGAEVVGQIIQERVSPDSAFFIGKGKLEQVHDIIEEYEASMVIFDDELTPAQVKNISKLLNDIKVIDRTALILDIFADHAKTSEAKTQVELAQLNYLLPRLTRQWQHLSRQVGGIGTKGPGETQLETDRRLVRTRISKLKAHLKDIDKQNETRRHKRDDMYRVSLIGYTNAGKSTLMNALTKAQILVENKLFATLDTTVRRLKISDSLSLLLADTVGFIRKLPHQLVASFRSTLSELDEADLLIHVVDVSHPHFEEHIQVVSSLLAEMGNQNKDKLLVFNKVDNINNDALNQIKIKFDNALFVSAERHIGLTKIKQALVNHFEAQYEIVKLKLDIANGSAEYNLRNYATILEKHYDDNCLYLKIKYHHDNAYKVKTFIEQNAYSLIQ